MLSTRKKNNIPVYTPAYMGKLYWRVKVRNKWTWKPVSTEFLDELKELLAKYGQKMSYLTDGEEVEIPDVE